MNDVAVIQILILFAQCLIVGSLLLFLFRLRTIFGLGVLFTTLGVFQYMQVFLVASLYIEVIPGIMVSPGSMVMFTGSLFAILLIYIREDALEARKVIYALLAANLVLAALQIIFSWAIEGEHVNNIYNLPTEFFTINSRVLFVGTIVLFFDAFVIIFLYEKISRYFSSILLRILISMVLVVSIDSLLFSFGAFAGTGQFWGILSSGLLAKISSAIVYTFLFTIYLKYIDKDPALGQDSSKEFQDIFHVLTYRQKYEKVYEEKESNKQELNKTQDKFRVLYETMAQGVTYQNTAGEITDANPAAQRILGLTIDQMQGKTSIDPSWKSIHEDGTDFPGETHASMVALKTGKRVNDVIMGVFNPLDQDYRWLKIDAIPQFRDGETTPYQVFTTFDDITEAKNAELLLKENEQKFRNIFENSVVGKSMTRIDGTLMVNKAFCNIVGYSAEELTTINWKDITHTDDVEYSEERIKTLIEGKENSARWEKRYIHKNGNIIWADINTVIQRDEKGEPIYFITAIYDITERKKAEQDLQVSELKFRNQAGFLDTIIESCPFAMWISDPNGYLIRVNQVLRDTLEISADLDITKYNILQDENFSNQGLTYILDDVFKNHKSSRFEMFWLGAETGKDNLSIPKKLWVFGSMFPITDQSGKLINVIFQYVDITDRKNAEQKLEESNRRFEKAQEMGNIANFEYDIVTEKYWVSNEGKRIFGYSMELEEITADLVWKCIIETEPEQKAWIDLIEKDKPYDIEYEIRPASGPSSKIIRSIAEVVKDKLGNPIKVVGLIQDITERKKQEQEILRQAEFINTMTENQPAGVVACDADGKLVLFNKAAKEWHGTDVMNISQHEWAKHYGLYSADGIAMLEKNEVPLMKAYNGEKVENYEMIIKTAGQKTRLVSCSGGSFTNQTGTSLGAVIVMNDITLQREIENNLIKSEKLAHQALVKVERSELLLNETGKLAKVGGWDLDLATMTPHFTEATSRIYEIPHGIPPKVEDGIKFYAPEARELVQEVLSEAIEKHKSYDIEVPFITAKGKNIWVRTIGQTVVKNGKAVRLFGAMQDITQIKKAEKELRDSENKLRELLNSLESGVVVHAPDTSIKYHNQRAAEILRSSYNNLTGKHVFDYPWNFLHEDNTILSVDDYPISQILKSKEGIKNMIIGMTHSDNTVWALLNGYPILNEKDEIKEVVISFIEITEQVKVNSKIKESEERYKLLAENITDVVSLHAKDATYEYVSSSIQNVRGYEPQELIGKNPYDYMHPDDIEEASSDVHSKRLEKGLPTKMEYRFKHKDGHYSWFESNRQPILDENGNVIKVVSSSRDITERKKAEEELYNYRDRLEDLVEARTSELKEVNKELESFSYSVSHDLRAPIRHINGYIDMLYHHFPDALPEKGKHFLDTIADSANQMGTLIDDLLELSRTGRQAIDIKTIDMNEVINEVLNSFEHDIDERDIEWKIVEFPKINCDRSLIKLVWVNLISNAIKFTGKIEKAIIEVGYQYKNKEHTIFISDNGVGFNMKYADKLFGAFQRLHSKADFEGTGIGLANFQRIIHRHKGRVWAESDEGKGATFYFTIPK